jgi:hypothetical protein
MSELLGYLGESERTGDCEEVGEEMTSGSVADFCSGKLVGKGTEGGV